TQVRAHRHASASRSAGEEIVNTNSMGIVHIWEPDSYTSDSCSCGWLPPRNSINPHLDWEAHVDGLETKSATDNFFHIGETSLEATFDRVLVLIDQFKSGYECKRCAGSGKVPCSECIGGRSAINPEILCKFCHGEMKIDCPECNGKGGLLV